MKKVSNFYCLFLGIFIIYFNLIPIIGPIISAYLLGKNHNRYEKEFMITKKLLIKTIFISNVLFFFLLTLILKYTTEIGNKKDFWLAIILGLIINISLAIISFFEGKRNK
jgi:MFS family permease